jgi:hypothetical protein
MASELSGGCQCGAVRFRVAGPVARANICNCRMCQKALGNLFGAWAEFDSEVQWTRGRPTLFRSSQRVRRGFCNQCGTPLSYQRGDHRMALSIGAFDRPNDIMPTEELARDNRHPLVGHADELREQQIGAADEERDILAVLNSFQHPDHDTETWPPRGDK